MKKIEIEYQGQMIKAWGLKHQGSLWLHFEGRTHEIVEPSMSSARSRKGQTGGNEIKSPMPGKVIRVNVTEGEQVKSGQTLATLEAMKMEYALKAPRDARIKAVSCQAGQQVAVGATLIYLEDPNG